MGRFTQIPVGAFDKIQINAGVILKEFLKYDETGKIITEPDETTFSRENIIGVTSGGISFASNPNYIDYGEDMDNVPANTWQLKRVTYYNPVLSGTLVTIDNNIGKNLIGGATTSKLKTTNSNEVEEDNKTNLYKVTPQITLNVDSFPNLWFVGDYTTDNTAEKGGFIAIHLKHAISTGGFQWQSTKDGKGTFAFEFTGHYDLDNIDDQPFDLYVKEPDTEAE